MQVDSAKHEVDLCTVSKELSVGSMLPARVSALSGKPHNCEWTVMCQTSGLHSY